ncbi:MAG TPA: transcriptional regulator, partial [Mycobacterium sp.]
QSPSGRWSHRLSPRHAELLLLLAVAPNGLTSAQLSQELYSSDEHVVAVRAEISRLRKHLGGVLEQRPYRFADWADVTVTAPASSADLLPASTAPTIRALRAGHSPGISAP